MGRETLVARGITHMCSSGSEVLSHGLCSSEGRGGSMSGLPVQSGRPVPFGHAQMPFAMMGWSDEFHAAIGSTNLDA